MDLFSFPPLSATLDAAYALLMGVAALLQPITGAASAAVAVVILTLLVRTILIPTGVAQAKADQTRARLAPKLQALQLRHKNDRERLQRETMKLYADEKASPFAGFLPVLIQAPVVGILYTLFLHADIAGHANTLLTEHVMGVPLGASLVGLIGSGTLTWSAVAVFGVVVVLIAAVAETTRRFLRPAPTVTASTPGGEGMVRVVGVLHFGTAVAAVFVPLAAGLYLLVTVAWTLTQRLILRRRFPADGRIRARSGTGRENGTMSRRKDGKPRSVSAAGGLGGESMSAQGRARAQHMSLGDPRRSIPSRLEADEFFLRPITATDAARDHEAVMETRVDLRIWEQSSWPADDFTIDANREDLADLERRHLDRRAFTYTVLTPDGTTCLGCVYIFPTTATFLAKAAVTPLTEEAEWAEVDAVVYFWIRQSRIASAMDVRLLAAIRTWLDETWALTRTVFVTNEQFERQVHLLDSAGLQVEFELREPGKPGTYLVYG